MRLLAALALLWVGLAHAGHDSLGPNYDVKADVTETCASCHGLRYLDLAQGYDTPAEWSQLIASMVKLPQERDWAISQYLAANYPHKPDKAPVLMKGDTDITIEEWVTPTLGQRTRDPVESPDGAIWWTGMWASLVGRLDPNTGAMQEYQLPSSARPHSIVPDADGFIWYTGNSNGTIGRLNPADGSIKEYPTRARDPHTAVFHPNGNLYFTSQHSNMLGRLNPKTGELKEVETRKKPYGIKVGKSGDLFIAYNGTNAIGRMHPDTMSVRYYDIPDTATRIRRLDIDSDQNVWFVNSSLGKVGRLDVDTGEVTQWNSPSGPTSHPYSMTVINDIVWYNESGMRPDALVRFDPATEQFQSWAVPSGIGIIRHTWETQDGDLLIHQSSSNQVGRVRIAD
jgi:virginiamycin B lyase